MKSPNFARSKAQEADVIRQSPTHGAATPGAIDSLKEIWRGFRTEPAAFIITCVYLIFEYNRPHLVYPAIDVIPWGKTLLFLAIFFAFQDKNFKAPPGIAVRPMLAFGCCVLLSMVFAHSPAVAFDQWIMFFGWFFVVLLLTSVINTKKRLFLFLVVYFLVNLKMAQHGFKTWVLRGFGSASWGATGSPGWFQNSGEFGMQMAVTLPLILAFVATFRKDWSRSVRYFLYFFAVMVVGSIIASNSRGAVLGLVMVGLWCLCFSRKRLKAFAVVAIFSALIYMSIPPEFLERFEAAGEDSTSISRLNYWNAGKETIRNNPVLGIGFRNWTTWVQDNYPDLIGRGGRIEVIHNTYLEAATELGGLGFSVYIVILALVLYMNFKSYKGAKAVGDRFLLATAAGLSGSLFAYIVPSYFMSVLYYPFIWLLFALTTCVFTISRKSE